jgi:CheY-like chemotaxis protein/nitrogen-specific signal transduction histidine kinase
VRRNAEIEHASLRQLVEETERRREMEARAQQGQKMEALGRLTGGVAHDFNNLLAIILGSLELVMRRESDARKIRWLTAATQAAQRGAKLTAQMLAFSRRHEISVQPVDINAVIRGMDELLLRTLGPGTQLRYDLATDAWPALADVTQLELALLNLAVNARDAMPEGGQILFQTRNTEAAHREVPSLATGDYVCLIVNDTGDGMSDEVRARAVEPFYTTKPPGGGTGLGLSMVAGFVEEIGGGLIIDSTVGRGTTVSLFLRKSEVSPSVAVPLPMPIAASGELRILLVDDDDGVRGSVHAMLEDLGHTVVDANDGTAALEVLTRDRRFDLLILDFAMPAMNGAQLAGQITAIWAGAPILFVTGYVENDSLRPWSDKGYQTLRKPFSSAELAEAIGRVAQQSEPVGN